VTDFFALAGLVAAVAGAAALVVWRERVKVAARSSAVFVGEVREEVRKVTWPDKAQLKNATLVILVFVAIVSLLIGVLDIVLQWLVVTLPARLF
jgi:preprotein translocase subunit SecE